MYYERLYDTKFNDIEEMGQFLEMYKLPGLNHKELENPNSPSTVRKLRQPSRTSLKLKVEDQMASLVNYNRHSKETGYLFSNSSKNVKKRHHFLTQF